MSNIQNTNDHYLLDFLDFAIKKCTVNASDLLDIYKEFISKKIVHITPEIQCAYIYKRGSKLNKINSQCTVKVKSDSGFCSKHKKYKQDMNSELEPDLEDITDEEDIVETENDDEDNENDDVVDIEDVSEIEDEVDDWTEEVFSEEEF